MSELLFEVGNCLTAAGLYRGGQCALYLRPVVGNSSEGGLFAGDRIEEQKFLDGIEDSTAAVFVGRNDFGIDGAIHNVKPGVPLQQQRLVVVERGK